MLGKMMHRPLRISDILEFAADAFPTAEIISARTEGDIHRQTYPETRDRVCQLAHALHKLGVEMGDRVATLAWNGYRHFELYYAVSGTQVSPQAYERAPCEHRCKDYHLWAQIDKVQVAAILF